jgi:rare lipoprotein A
MRCFLRASFAPALLVLALSAGLMAPTAADARSYYGSSSAWDDAEGTPSHLYRSDDEEERAQSKPARQKRHAKRHRDTRAAKQRRQRRQIARQRDSDRRTAQHRKSTRKASARTARRSTPTWSKRSLSTAGPKGSGQLGIASYYWQPQRVAAGGWFNPNAMTAAHRTLPFGTRVRVTHLASGRTVEVKINDRGPYIAGRIIDLSKAAAGVLRMHEQGIARVSVEVLGR